MQTDDVTMQEARQHPYSHSGLSPAAVSVPRARAVRAQQLAESLAPYYEVYHDAIAIFRHTETGDEDGSPDGEFVGALHLAVGWPRPEVTTVYALEVGAGSTLPQVARHLPLLFGPL